MRLSKLNSFMRNMSTNIYTCHLYTCTKGVNVIKIKNLYRDKFQQFHAESPSINDLVCSNCWNVVHSKLSIDGPDIYTQFQFINDIQASANRWQCPHCKQAGSLIMIDSGISDIICTLNRKNYKTAYCCEGHLSKNLYNINPYIKFKRDYSCIIRAHRIPNGWTYYAPVVIDDNGQCTGETVSMLEWPWLLEKPTWGSLLEWVESLPVVSHENVRAYLTMQM